MKGSVVFETEGRRFRAAISRARKYDRNKGGELMAHVSDKGSSSVPR